jgi:hypothetical protein
VNGERVQSSRRSRSRIPASRAIRSLPGPGDDKAAEVARLRALGATDLDVGQGDVPWTCAWHPERNGRSAVERGPI